MIAGPESSVRAESAEFDEPKLGDPGFDRFCEGGDVVGRVSICVDVALGLMSPAGIFMGVGSGVFVLTGDGLRLADVVLADFWCPSLRTAEVVLLRLVRLGVIPCCGLAIAAIELPWRSTFPGLTTPLLRVESSVPGALL